jgi:hypothetical protein
MKKTTDSTLRRSDKWYLGGGGRLLWAPPFPKFLDRPGFWDPAHYFNLEVAPLFTWTLLDEEGKEIALASGKRTWTPAVLTSVHHGPRGSGISVTEEKFVLPFGVASATVRITNRLRKPRRLHLVGWTAQPSGPSRGSRIDGCTWHDSRLAFIRCMTPPQRPEHPVAVTFGLDGKPTSYEVRYSEGTLQTPDWRLTPFFESFRRHLSGKISTTGVGTDGLMFMGVHAVIMLPPGGDTERTIAMALAPAREESGRCHVLVTHHDRPAALSHAAWDEHFASVPRFSCSDPFLTNFFRHRWYGLRVNTVSVEEGHYRHPFVCEGIGYFRAPISYSAFCHMLENRWRRSPDLARGSLLTFTGNQRADGGFRGYIDVGHYRQDMFYHADWGRAVRELHRVHPSTGFLASVYDPLVKYVEYFDHERDAEGSGLYDIDNHYETGQEFMHRYTAVFPDADRDNWGKVFRLKGIDVTVYLYVLKQTLAWMAGVIDRTGDAARWQAGAEAIGEAVRNSMWDPDEQLFFDVDPATGRRTGVKAAVCFYPFMTDLVTADHLPALRRHLFNPAEFWTPFPVPSSSADDEMFSAEPVWKGMRMNCPWNGRVWPMTNSHIADALGASAIRFESPELRRRTAEFIQRFIRMMFFDGDPERPNTFEHYNPLTGAPSTYRGIDDYQHSWINDLILRYVAGIRPGDGVLTVDPFPFPLDWFRCDNVIVAGHSVSVERTGSTFIVTVDGLPTAGRVGVPQRVMLSPPERHV